MNAGLSSTEAQRRLAERPERSPRGDTTRVFWEVGAFSNLWLLGVVVFSVLMQLGMHYLPAAQAVFQIGPLSAADCGLTLLVALGPVTVIEMSKLVRRWFTRGTSA